MAAIGSMAAAPDGETAGQQEAAQGADAEQLARIVSEEGRETLGVADPSAACVQVLREMMGKTVRATLSDERVVQGTFECVDDAVNVIVRDVKLGLVMLPGEHVVKMELWREADATENGAAKTTQTPAEAAPAAGAAGTP